MVQLSICDDTTVMTILDMEEDDITRSASILDLNMILDGDLNFEEEDNHTPISSILANNL